LTQFKNKLRKHIATKCITLNFTESEVTELANFMGHDKSIYKSHYRQSIPEIDIPKFSRLLHVATINNEAENDEDDKVVEQNLISENVIEFSESSYSDNCESNNKMSSKTPKKKQRSSKYIFNKITF